jgi:3',5'-cyclic AMP phosphodiesterase CpdA
MRPVRWLHISDIHMRPQDAWEQDVVLRAMREDIERQHAELPIDFVLVSGDLAYSGKAEEYALVGQFFTALAAAAGVQIERIFCIPGNHDIDRGRQRLCFRGARAALQDPNITDAFLASPAADDFQTLLQRQQAYRRFQTDFFGGQQRSATGDGLGYVSRLSIDGIRIAILALDSAWLAEGGVDDHLKLLIGERQVLNAIELLRTSLEPPHIVAAMAHHPLHLLQDFDRRTVQARIDAYCHFFHSGHLHNPETRPTGDRCLTLTAGASFETRHTHNAYSVITLDLLRGVRTARIAHYTPTDLAFSSVWMRDYRIEVLPAGACEVGELAGAIAARSASAWPHYVAALLLAKKSDLPVSVAGGHVLASFEALDALLDGDLKHTTSAFLTFRNALRVLYGREPLDEIFRHHGDAVTEYCAALDALCAVDSVLRGRLDEQERDAVRLAGGESSSSFAHTSALLRELADEREWGQLREQAERHADADDTALASEAKRMLALALANSLEAADKQAAIALYRSLAESPASDPSDTGNLATLLMEAGTPEEASDVLLRGMANCPRERLDYLAEIGYRIVDATGNREFRHQLRATIAGRDAP